MVAAGAGQKLRHTQGNRVQKQSEMPAAKTDRCIDRNASCNRTKTDARKDRQMLDELDELDVKDVTDGLR